MEAAAVIGGTGYYLAKHTDVGAECWSAAYQAGESVYEYGKSGATSGYDAVSGVASTAASTVGGWKDSIVSNTGPIISSAASSVYNGYSGVTGYIGSKWAGVSEAYPTASRIGKETALKGAMGYGVNAAMSFFRPATAKEKQAQTGVHRIAR
jgi:hypothetical protein